MVNILVQYRVDDYRYCMIYKNRFMSNYLVINNYDR